MTFALIRSLVLMRLQNCSINWGKVVSLPHHGSFPVAEYECLWIRVSCVKEGGFHGVAYVLSVFGHSRLEIAGLHYNILNNPREVS